MFLPVGVGGRGDGGGARGGAGRRRAGRGEARRGGDKPCLAPQRLARPRAGLAGAPAPCRTMARKAVGGQSPQGRNVSCRRVGSSLVRFFCLRAWSGAGKVKSPFERRAQAQRPCINVFCLWVWAGVGRGGGRGGAGRGQTLLGSPTPCTTMGRLGRRPSALQDYGPQGGGRAIAAEA